MVNFLYRSVATGILALMLVNPGAAQQRLSGSCFDAETKKPIPFVTIKLKNANILSDADENGHFAFSINAPDTLFISCTGFGQKKIATAEIQPNSSIYLDPIVNILPEVIVGSKGKILRIGTPGKTKSFDMNSEACSRFELATRINVPEHIKNYRIKKVNITGSGFNRENPVRLHIYSIGPYGEPDKDLLTKDVVITEDASKKNVLSIDVDDQGLQLQENRFFIAIQWIADSLNLELLRPKKNAIVKPGIYCTYQDKSTITYLRSKNQKLGYQWMVITRKTMYPYDYQLPGVFDEPMNMLVSCDISY
jgi:hypothetical protein